MFFRPRTIAVIGATDRAHSVGAALIRNLREGGFAGRIFPVNPKHSVVDELPAFSSVMAVPDRVDLAVIVTPACTVPKIVEECVEAGVGAAVIISAGFREAGVEGTRLEREIVDRARGKMRIVGPNCLGLMNPAYNLNATFAGDIARPGNIAFISQSGALCTAILGWSRREGLGFSAFVSAGEMADVGWGDLIRYFGDDPQTRSIIIYMESIGNARDFLSAAREVALAKPIIVIRPGKTEGGAKAVASHTGALAAQDDVLDAALRRCGVLRVDTVSELFYLAEALEKQPRPRGPNLAIITNAGGPAVLAADALLQAGASLAPLSAETLSELNLNLPAHWSRQNPIDVLGDADAERYVKAVDLAAKDPSVNGLLVILTPQGMTDSAVIASGLKSVKTGGKPMIACWMGGVDVEKGEAILNQARIPCYAWPEAAARVFALMWRYGANIRALYETPQSFEIEDPGASIQMQARAKVRQLLAAIRDSGRTLLTEAESREILAAYGVPFVRGSVATQREDAVEAARRVGYPVAVKLHSESITHKTDVGGVVLNINEDDGVRAAWGAISESVERMAGKGHFDGVIVEKMVDSTGYELIVGCKSDAQFGPVVLFGAGGQLAEIWRDTSLELPPLNTTLARSMISRTRISKALQGFRGRKQVNMAAIERLLVRFSYFVAEQDLIREVDINPLLATEKGLIAVDARIVLHPADATGIPRSAIRRYPTQYVSAWRLADGREIMIRPIRPEDEPLVAAFHGTLSDASVHQRYFHSFGLRQRVSHERLVRVCFGDYDREIALVAMDMGGQNSPDNRNSAGDHAQIIGIGRLVRTNNESEGEIALLVADQHQSRGLGLELTRRLLEIARAEHISRVRISLLADNARMISICRETGFSLDFPVDGVIDGSLEIPAVIA
jgi:acetyltransferase